MAYGARLRIGLIAPPWVSVPPPVYGGTELVVDQLARGLTFAGCDVSLFTTGDSSCPVDRQFHYPTALGTTAALDAEVPHVEAAYRSLATMDVIHDHTLGGPLWASEHGVDVPVITTAHGPFTPELLDHFGAVAATGAGVVAISHAQRRSAPGLPVTAVIHHGIDLAAIPFGAGDGGYVLFLGRMHPDKGVHRAIDAARSAGMPILVAAKMWEPAERCYFEEQIEPRLGRDALYLGEVGGRRKAELIAGAVALVNPIRWPEPFGLVMIEALASGTPVVTFPEGAAPEIVEHGRTGYLCEHDWDLPRAITAARDLDRWACRASVERRFTTARMVADHLALYACLVEARRRITTSLSVV